jgi:hypothetical protein
MTLRDQTTPPLSAGDLAALKLLRADRDAAGEGVTPAALGAAAGTRFLDSLLRRLRKHRYMIGVNSDGSWELGHGGAERATDQRAATSAKDDQACAPRPVDGSLSAEDRLFELPPLRHHDVKAQAA